MFQKQWQISTLNLAVHVAAGRPSERPGSFGFVTAETRLSAADPLQSFRKIG